MPRFIPRVYKPTERKSKTSLASRLARLDADSAARADRVDVLPGGFGTIRFFAPGLNGKPILFVTLSTEAEDEEDFALAEILHSSQEIAPCA